MSDKSSDDIQSSSSGSSSEQNEIANDIAITYAQSYVEIDRRKQACSDQAKRILEMQQFMQQNKSAAIDSGHSSNLGNNNNTNADQQQTSLSLLPSIDGYQFVLLNKCHIMQRPRAKCAGFRILGFFTTREDAINHLKLLPNDCNVHIAPRMSWVLLPKTIERDKDVKYVHEKLEQIRKLHIDERRKADEDFKANVEKKQTGKIGLSLEKQKQKQNSRAKKTKRYAGRKRALDVVTKQIQDAVLNDSSKSVQKIPRNAELRRQTCAIVAIWKDYTESAMKLTDEPEPAILFIDAFDDDKAAQKHIESTLSADITMLDLDVVDMYEFVFPEYMSADKLPQGSEVWRNSEQTMVMQQHRGEQQSINKLLKDNPAGPGAFAALGAKPDITQSDNKQKPDMSQTRDDKSQQSDNKQKPDIANDSNNTNFDKMDSESASISELSEQLLDDPISRKAMASASLSNNLIELK